VCQEYSYQKLLKSDNSSSGYNQKMSGIFLRLSVLIKIRFICLSIEVAAHTDARTHWIVIDLTDIAGLHNTVVTRI